MRAQMRVGSAKTNMRFFPPIVFPIVKSDGRSGGDDNRTNDFPLV